MYARFSTFWAERIGDAYEAEWLLINPGKEGGD